MSDIIHILPDSVANQIAAGEVIQRPASVVKELVENSIDSGATEISVNIKDAGKTLIQIIDNGSGMSETDARMAFERHSTSKINKADDLFSIKTFGFRGEALASIAAISTVELKTKKKDSDLGINIVISASEVTNQTPVSCSNGSNFSVKNLFFNVPARRKFLKSDSSEIRHIIDEFQRVALAHPEIALTLIHNGNEIYNLPSSILKQRIINIFGKSINQQIIPLNTETSIINVYGYISKPEHSKKVSGNQFFFVNNRFMRHPYFNKAISNAYENIVKPNEYIPYFIYFSVDPNTLDVNIHPTKTEIKFEDEKAIWQILRSSIKETLGKFNIVPSIDFDIQTPFQISSTTSKTEIFQPNIEINKSFNPFNTEQKSTYKSKPDSIRQESNLNNWEKLFEGFENENKNTTPTPETKTIFKNESPINDFAENITSDNNKFFQFKVKYLITAVKSGLMIIDQKRAHERILYEKFINTINLSTIPSQKILYPKRIELNKSERVAFNSIIPELEQLGFIIEEISDTSIEISGIPYDMNESDIENVIETIIDNFKLYDMSNIKDDIFEKLVVSLSKAASINYGKVLSSEEIRNLIDNLFACKSPSISPSGKTIISIIETSYIENMFNNKS